MTESSDCVADSRQAAVDLGEVHPDAVIRARAPLRVSFCGGGTDLMPYAADHGGLVLNATLARYAYATLRLIPEDAIRVRSLDYDTIATFRLDEPLIYDGSLDLVKACLRRLRVGPEVGRGLEMYLETDAPPGSGLGSSSALVVAMIGTFMSWRRLALTKYQIAELAYDLERKDVGIAGGMQDQYASVFGGFNLIEFHGEHDVVVNPLRVDPDVAHELEYNSLLAFTGGTRLSSHIIDSQVGGYTRGDPEVVAAMAEIKRLVSDAKAALLRGRIAELGEILHEQWTQKKRTSIAISTPHIDRIYAEVRSLGVIGGKMSGAGGGGFMFLICPFDRRPAVNERLRELGCTVAPVEFEPEGMQTWIGSPVSAPIPTTPS
jgi:D-glycero-alpha-D-manno-heptose-7-phosphate kinase